MRKWDVSQEVTQSYLPAQISGMAEVRTFAWGRVIAGAWDDALVLVIQEWWDRKERNTFYECRDILELEREIERVRQFGMGNDGGDGAGFPSTLGPTPPSRSAGDAHPFPDLDLPE